MAKSSQIKKLLKSEDLWKDYKKKFANKQMRFVFTKIAGLYSPTAPVGEIVRAEKILLATPVGPDMFVKGMTRMSTLTLTNSKLKHSSADWKSFGKYMWYQYQTSTYWKDVKKGIPNIYSEKTYIKLNSKKRDHYQKWVSSLDQHRPEFNADLIAIIKKVS